MARVETTRWLLVHGTRLRYGGRRPNAAHAGGTDALHAVGPLAWRGLAEKALDSPTYIETERRHAFVLWSLRVREWLCLLRSARAFHEHERWSGYSARSYPEPTSMSFKSAVLGNVFLVQWDQVERGDGSLLTRAVEEAAASVGSQLIYIAVSARLSPPEDGVRPEISRLFETVLELCSQVHLVIQQQGFMGAIHRTIAAGMLLAIDRRGKKVGIHASLEDALRQSVGLAIDPDIVVKIARVRGIVA